MPNLKTIEMKRQTFCHLLIAMVVSLGMLSFSHNANAQDDHDETSSYVQPEYNTACEYAAPVLTVTFEDLVCNAAYDYVSRSEASASPVPDIIDGASPDISDNLLHTISLAIGSGFETTDPSYASSASNESTSNRKNYASNAIYNLYRLDLLGVFTPQTFCRYVIV